MSCLQPQQFNRGNSRIW